MPKRRPGKKGQGGKGPAPVDGAGSSECLLASVQKEQEWVGAHPESCDQKFFLDEMVNNPDPEKRIVQIPTDRLVALMKLMAGGAGPIGSLQIRNGAPSPTGAAINPGGLVKLHNDLRKAIPTAAGLLEVTYRSRGGADLLDGDLGRLEQEWFDAWRQAGEENEVQSHQEVLEKAEQAWKTVQHMPHRECDIHTSLGPVAPELGHEAAPTPCLQYDQHEHVVRLDLAAAADGAPSSYAWLFGDDATTVSSPRRQVWPVGAKELGAAASGPKCGGVSRNDFDRRLGKMNQDQETDGLIETWKNAVRRTCLHYVAYADARDGMDGMKEARQFRSGIFHGGTHNFEGMLLEIRTVARSARHRVKLKIFGIKREAKLFQKEHDSSMPKLAKLRTMPVGTVSGSSQRRIRTAKRPVNPAEERTLVESLFQNMTKFACKEPAMMAEKQLEGQLDELLHMVEKALTKTETSDARLLEKDAMAAIFQHRALPDFFDYEKKKLMYHGGMLKTMLLVKGRVADALQARVRSDPLLEALRCAVQCTICQRYQESRNDKERECNQRVYDELVAEEARNKAKAEAKRLKRKQKEEERLREKREADDRQKREHDRLKRELEQEQERVALLQREADKKVQEENGRRERERELARALVDARHEEEENRELQEALMKVSMIELFDKVESTSAYANVLTRETAAVSNPKQPGAWGSSSAHQDGPAGASGSRATAKPKKSWDTQRPKASKFATPKAIVPSGKAPVTKSGHRRAEQRPTEGGPGVTKTFPSQQSPQPTPWNWHDRAANPGSLPADVPDTTVDAAPVARCDAVDQALSCAAHIVRRVQALGHGLSAGGTACHDANVMLAEAAADESTVIGHDTCGRAIINGMLKDSGSALEQNPASITIVETLELLLEHLALVSCPVQDDDTSDLAHLSLVHRVFGVVKVSWASAVEVADAYCTFVIQATLPALWQSGITRPTASGSSSKVTPVLQVRLPKVILVSLPETCDDEDIKALQGLVGRAPINVLQMLGATRFADKLSDPPASHTGDLYRLAAIACTDGVDLRTIHLPSVLSTPDDFCEARTWSSGSSKRTKVRKSWRQISALVGVGSFRPSLLVLQHDSASQPV